MSRVSKSNSPSVGVRTNWALPLVAVAALALAGCGGPEKPVGSVGYVKGFGGLVAADEPRAVLVARDVLSAGGTVADAAIALYFTLAVTQPSTASLGGGGVCVIHTGDRKTAKTEVVDFLSPPSAMAASMATPTAVPGAVRGLFALHAKHGRLRWEQLLAEPERLARFGAPVSRAFAVDLAKAAPLLARDSEARRLFFRPDGRVLAEGDTLQQTDLAVAIGRIRRAPGDFYAGPMAREMAQRAQAAGLSLTVEDLRDYRPQFRAPVAVKMGLETAYFAPPPAIASGATAEITRMMVERPAERSAILTQASAQAASAPAVMPGTGFVIMDSEGAALACGLSTQGVFGNGRILPGSGIVMAAAPGINGGPPAVAPLLLINHNVNEVRFAGTATGGGEAPMVMAATLMAVAVDGSRLDEAVRRPAPATATPQSVFAPTRVNALACSSGAPGFATCRAATDPNGHGLAVVVGKD